MILPFIHDAGIQKMQINELYKDITVRHAEMYSSESETQINFERKLHSYGKYVHGGEFV